MDFLKIDAREKYGHLKYNELPNIIRLGAVQFPRGEEFCIHCKNKIEIGDWYKSPCLCYDCKSTPEKPPKEYRKAQLRKWNKDKKALDLEKEYMKKVNSYSINRFDNQFFRINWSTWFILLALFFLFYFLSELINIFYK